MLPTRPLKVFLCHATADKHAVRCLYYSLVDFGVDAWLDAEDLLSGQGWEMEIPRAIKDSDAIIICLSKDSIYKRGYVQKEIRFALDEAGKMPSGRIFLVPVRLDNDNILHDLPAKLQEIQHVNLCEEDGCFKFLQSLQVIIEQVGANPITNSTGGSLRDKARQLAKMIVREMRRKEIRQQNQQIRKPGIAETTPEIQKTHNPRKRKISVWSIGIFFTILSVLLALAISRITAFKSLQSPLITETSTRSSITDTPTFVPVVISHVTEEFIVSDTPNYTPTLHKETSTLVVPTQMPPIQPPPTQILPTRIPPTQAPPTQAPPTQIPPTQIPTTQAPPTRDTSVQDGKLIFDSPVNGNWQVFSINPDGSELRQLTNTSNGIGDPAISPNGQMIVFVGDASTKSLYVMQADGTQIRSIYQTSVEVGWPSWSFDSQKIVFAEQNNGYKNLYMMNSDGTNVTRLTDISANDLAPTFSPNGTQIAFSSDRSGSWEIYKLDISSGQITKLTNLGDPEGQGWPSWSSDGSKIAFESRGNSGKRDIFTMYTDGTQVKNITDSSKYEGAPVWSPDGSMIAFASDRDGGLDIYLMQNNGEHIQRLTTIWAWGPSWSLVK